MMLRDVSRSQQSKGAHKRMAGVWDWIEQTGSPSGSGAQPPVTPLQPQQEIIQFHLHASRRSAGWWSILWESRENRSYLELRLPGPLFLSITSQTQDMPSQLAETAAIIHFRHISRTTHSEPWSNFTLILSLKFLWGKRKLFTKLSYNIIFWFCLFQCFIAAKIWRVHWVNT